MLTDTEVHYLVAFVCMVSNPETVDVELGNFIADRASGTKRDVDITITYQDDDGSIAGYIAREVKAYNKRPLDVGHIDGLCQKFNDMPQIIHRGIVSSSGYTEAAKAKAKYHNVDLYHWIKVTEPINVGGIVMMPNTTVEGYWSEWIGSPHVNFNVDTGGKITKLSDQATVKTRNGDPIPNCNNLIDFSRLVAKLALDQVRPEFVHPNDVRTPTFTEFEVNVNVADQPCIVDGDISITVEHGTVNGVVKISKLDGNIDLYTLIKDGEEPNKIACAVFEAPWGDLTGFSLSDYDGQRLTGFTINMTERLRKKIKNLSTHKVIHSGRSATITLLIKPDQDANSDERCS